MVDPCWSLDSWRDHARHALQARIAPHALVWQEEQAGLLPAAALDSAPVVRDAPSVDARFPALAASVLCHRDPARHSLLYRIAWRLADGERGLLQRATDPDIRRATMLAQAVQRDTHKMKAFVRFRALAGAADSFVAWFEPQHWIVDRVAPFFSQRFAGMRWAILTPYRSLRWDGVALQTGPGATRADAPSEDAHEDLWRTYYANIFNPARLNPTMMQQEMPRRYWKHLPEAALIPDLIRSATARSDAMQARAPEPVRRRLPAPTSVPAIASPRPDNLATLAAQITQCRRCELWRDATRAVPGSGPASVSIVLVGEQPGDVEDLRGQPFIGPAGKLLDRALLELGIAREALYLTNAVKHFGFEQRGKVRLHKTPRPEHINACSAWLQHELALLRPRVVVALGAVAARALFGTRFDFQHQRGQRQAMQHGAWGFATVHPAWVLRQAGDAAREAAYRGLVDDLCALADVGPD